MNRRYYLLSILAGAATSDIAHSTWSSLGVSGRSGWSSNGDSLPHKDWIPHTRIDIDRDGRAHVTVTLEGSEIPHLMLLSHLNTQNVVIESGEDALEERDENYRWDTNVRTDIEYSIDLGHSAPGSSAFGVFDECIISYGEELLKLNWDGDDGIPQANRFELVPPEGWTATTGGNKVDDLTFDTAVRQGVHRNAPRELFFFGDATVHSKSIDDDSELRVVQMPDAAGEDPADILDQLVDAIPRFEEYYGVDTFFSKLCIVVTDDVEPPNGGQAFDNTCLVNEGAELIATHDTYMQELAGLYNRRTSPRWVRNGFRSYIQRVILYDIGRISEDKLYDDIQSYATDGGDEPIHETASARSFRKGAAVCAALDMDLRARTDGEATIGDWHGPLNERVLDDSLRDIAFGREDALDQLNSLVGIDYSNFYETYIQGLEYPMEILSDEFSLTEPMRVEFGWLEVTDTVVPEEVYRGDPVSITVPVANPGEAAVTQEIELEIDGAVETTRQVSLASGETDEVEFVLSFDELGQREIRIPHQVERVVTVMKPYELTDLSVTSDELSTEEAFEVTATVTNVSNVPQQIDLVLQEWVDDGHEPLEGTTLELEAGEATDITLYHSFGEPGQYTLYLNKQPVESVTVIERSSDIAIVDSDLNPEAVTTDEAFEVTVTVVNEGTIAGERRLEMAVNDDVLAVETVSVEVDQERTVTFEWVFDDPGEYPVTINEVEVGIVSVDSSATPDPTPTSTDDGIPGPGIVGTVGSILGAGYVMKWWSATQGDTEK